MLDILGVVEGLGRNDVEIVDVIDQHRSKVPIVDLRLDTRHVCTWTSIATITTC